MNSIVLLAVCLLIVTNYMVNGETKAELIQQWEQAIKNCNLSQEIVDKLLGPSLDASFAKDITCIYKSLEIMNPDGTFNKDKLRLPLQYNILNDDDKIEKVMDMCAVQKATEEESSLYLFNCMGNIFKQ
ncbi:uncharacterized protein LOC114343807 isoform X2 [Diabrotica virgifera virgifera]|uniref:Uncharacterized protein LOC114343807 isoform X2 n=1 Tax=Diabrotica virgifera virgifera TaxID=50390 RepID=A0A6P7GYE9_DIAVI|nr:uncharacterized protein LOC114343807 isoform X2 [Diabrotica virgifera virgifera]